MNGVNIKYLRLSRCLVKLTQNTSGVGNINVVITSSLIDKFSNDTDDGCSARLNMASLMK